MQVLLYALIAAGYVLYLVIAILLVRTYRRTNDVGFIWLGTAVLVWPVVARLLESALRFNVGRVAPLAHLSQQVFSLALLLIAVLYLSKTKNQVDTRPA